MPRGFPGAPPSRREAGGNTHQAVSSRKMPSRSRCVKSSPPATHTCQQLCAGTKLLCSSSLGFLLGESGARISRPTCLTELPWGFNSIQQTSTDAYSVPGPVLGEAGDTEMKRPSHCPQDAQSSEETDMHTMALTGQTEATAPRARPKKSHAGDKGQNSPQSEGTGGLWQ